MDLSEIRSLTRLETLVLNGNIIRDLLPIRNLIRLRTLNLNANQVENIAPLAHLVELVDLNLGINNINDIAPLQDLTNLISLDLENNYITDIQALVDNPGLGEEPRNRVVLLRSNCLDITPGSKDDDDIQHLIRINVDVQYDPQKDPVDCVFPIGVYQGDSDIPESTTFPNPPAGCDYDDRSGAGAGEKARQRFLRIADLIGATPGVDEQRDPRNASRR